MPRITHTRLPACVLASTLVLCGCSKGPAASTPLDPYAVLPGVWGWEGTNDCATSPQTIIFSTDRNEMRLSLVPAKADGTHEPRREVTYQILHDFPDGLNMSMDGEHRLDPAGKPVTWDLLLLDRDQYCWHRSDWPGTGCTKPILRCKASTNDPQA